MPFTIQSETPACSGRPNPSGPSSSCRRWDSPDCRGETERGRSVSGVCSGAGDEMLCAVPSPCAEHILMEGTLTALALSPQAGETLLQCVQVIDLCMRNHSSS